MEHFPKNILLSLSLSPYFAAAQAKRRRWNFYDAGALLERQIQPKACQMRSATECRDRMAVCMGAAMAIWLSASPVWAFTCDDVRSLSMEEQNYWSQRLHLSALQRHVIWVTCYQKFNSGEIHVVRR